MPQLGKAVKGKSGKKLAATATAGDKNIEDAQEQEKLDFIKKLQLVEMNRLKGMLEEEKRLTKVNKLKIQNQWRSVMRTAKVQELRELIEIMSQTHERDVDRKDAIIQMLDRDLEQGAEQYRAALRAHLGHIDNLLAVQDERLLELESSFLQEVETMMREHEEEMEEIRTNHQDEVQYQQDIIKTLKEKFEEQMNETRQEFEQLREEVKNRDLEDVNVLRITLDAQIEELERHFETGHLNYLQNTDQRTQDFKHFTRKDQELSKEIDIKIRQIERLQNDLTHWKAKIKQNSEESETRNRDLQAEKDMITAHFQSLKDKMRKFREEQDRKLKALARNADNCKRKLHGDIELASKIITKSELNRKYETEREQIIPFLPMGKEHDEEDERPPEPEEGEAVEEDGGQEHYQKLDNFWKKYNKVMLDVVALDREKERLSAENDDLKSLLQQYLNGMSINEQAVDEANPLLVVNGRTNIMVPVRKIGAPATVVEANTVVNIQQRMTRAQ
eukprot:TRINITY_DN116_c4_g1_i1.p1 TRINITY_DN116_c4_g1~~TRINITY_DN116_c4_g1_i1.p1  ORF type:complete len:503 (-),score=175.67 TRINITY_DN116_c4_g1_i1:227-1735(-)